MVSGSQLTYRTATTVLRSPRVAVVIPGYGDWRGWVRRAVTAISRHWGGGGYILVPVDSDGGIHPDVLDVAVRYDPDYIARLDEAADVWFELAPDGLRFPGTEGMSEAAYDDMLRASPVTPTWAESATRVLLERCSPLSYARETRKITVHRVSSTDVSPPAEFLSAPPRGYDRPIAALAASTRWEDDVSLFALARTGAPAPDDDDRPEPSSDDLLRWVISADPADAPEGLLWFPSTEYSVLAKDSKPWFEAASPNLVTVWSWHNQDAAAVVIGDTVDDFAMAYALDRMLGYALWLTPDAITKRFPESFELQLRLKTAWDRISPYESVPTFSTSLSETQVHALVGRLQNPVYVISEPSPEDVDERDYEAHLVVRRPMLQDGAFRTLALSDHLGEQIAVPAFEDDDGTVRLQTGMASLLPEGPTEMLPLNRHGSPQWIVDVSVENRPTPAGRGLPAKYVLADGANDMTTLIRSSNAGVSFLAATLGFVTSTQVLSSRLASPRINQLGMFSWVRAMAERKQMTVSLSTPGRFADLLSHRLGSRQKLIDLVSGPLHPFLVEFVPGGAKSSREAFPDESGMVLNSQHVILRFEALTRLTPQLSDTRRRELVDELLRTGLLRQGLALNCADCGTFDFVSIDDLSQRFECKTCGAMNDFAAPRWKSLSNEPTWHYDLHRAFTKLLAGNGDVPLLAAHHLSNNGWSYYDTGEVEFTTAAGKVEFEIDLIAHTRGQVIVVEAKSAGTLGTGRARHDTICKRFEAARLLNADRVLFATTAPEWSVEDRRVASRIAEYDYRGIELDFVAGLAPVLTGDAAG